MTLLILAGLAGSAVSANCADPEQGWNAVGVRGGFSATQRRNEFHQYEVYATYGLPWSVRAESGWGVAMQGNVSAGVLHAKGENGFIGTFGPGVIFDKGDKGFALDLGGDLCFLNRYKFDEVDFNGNPLFEGHIGVAYRFKSGPGVSYRFQHMSNGGLGLHGPGNTGLDLHMFGVSWNF
jgi:hypothetical protein